MRKACTRLPEQGTQTPSPAPDLIPAEPKINRELTLGLGCGNYGFNAETKQFEDLVEDKTRPAMGRHPR
jgi:hypothetical protein